MKTIAALMALLVALNAQSSLRIVVIEGEGAVNIIQQKTAVAPIVEVRDQNNLPVAGAVVRFTIDGGKQAAFTGGSPTLSVTTNAAGRAAAGTINPLTSGSVQIQVQATFQGQTAAATITQSNVMTAAQAGQAAATSGAGGSGGGGMSGLAIAGIAGGVAAGGAAVALSKNDSGDNDADPATQAAVGTYVLQTVNGAGLPAITVTSPPASCPVVTDNATLTLKQNREYEVVESARTDCRLGPSSSFAGRFNGNWAVSGSTVTFTTGAPPGQYTFDSGTLDGATLTVMFQPPHMDSGLVAARVNSTWRK